MKTVRRPSVLFLAVAAAWLAAAPLAGQPAPLAGFDDWTAAAVKAWRIPGLAIAVVKDGGVVFAKGYGVREAGKPEPVDTHTLFAIGSTTKAMTAALAGMLVDDQKLAWDDPVTRYLPSFQLKDPAVTRELTVRDLLTHRGGLGNADYLWYGQSNTIAQILERVRLIEPAYSLRSGFVYQNIMYAAAGQVVAAAGGRPWAEMIRTRIFEPLGMRDTVATLAAVPTGGNVASPHYLLGDRVRVVENMSVDGVAPAGAVWSSVDDMSKWMQCLLAGGRIPGAEGKRLFSEKTAAELFKPQTMAPESMYPTTRLVKPHWMTYALGWFQQDYQGRAIDFHTGSIDGMVAIHGLVRDERLGVYVLANLDHAELRHALMYTVFDRFGGRSERDWSADLLALYGEIRQRDDDVEKRQESRRVSGTSPSLALDKYAGTYRDPLHGEVVVGLQGSALAIRYGPGFAGPLEHWHYNTFRARWTAEWHQPSLVTFEIGSSGQVVALELMNARFPRR